MFCQFFKENTVDLAVFKVVLCYCLGAAWRREKGYEDRRGSKGTLYQRMNAGSAPLFWGPVNQNTRQSLGIKARLESSVGIEDMMENVSFLSTCLSPEGTDHPLCPRESICARVSVLCILQFVMCFCKIRVLCPQNSWGVEEGLVLSQNKPEP